MKSDGGLVTQTTSGRGEEILWAYCMYQSATEVHQGNIQPGQG